MRAFVFPIMKNLKLSNFKDALCFSLIIKDGEIWNFYSLTNTITEYQSIKHINLYIQSIFFFNLTIFETLKNIFIQISTEMVNVYHDQIQQVTSSLSKILGTCIHHHRTIQLKRIKCYCFFCLVYKSRSFHCEHSDRYQWVRFVEMVAR